MKLLTSKQREVLSFIIHRQKRAGIPPTVREIAARLGKSVNNVRQHLRLIERKGHIRLIPGKARGIEVVVGFELERDE
ncbi:MAG: MarR family transcriptional regulator, partial [Chitinivibrionales bacterium]|nr:MarR family transcriptional regulator [Chitinivibrionales bacterium]MBD3356349.1 MarR family transcriptional regulator [Chitinivibrionales bacterium]